MRRLLKNAFVVSVDPRIGNLEGADILIEGERIVEIRPNLAVDDAEVIDASGYIASPGFVDTHHHVWQSLVRGITADWSLGDYLAGIRLFVASHYTPADMYLGQLGGTLQALNVGVTTTADYCHNLNSPEHVEEAIRASKDSGARVVWCYGFNRPPLPEQAFATLESRCDYLRRVAAQHFSSRATLVTLGVCPEEILFWPDMETGRKQFDLARELGVRQFWHANSTRDAITGAYRRDADRALAAGLLGSDTVLVHMNHTPEDEWVRVADAGCHLSVTPETEMQMNMGWPALSAAESHGVNVGVGVDIISNNSADLRFQLRLLLQNERWARSKDRSGIVSSHVPLDAARALYWGTMGGAKAVGLDDQIGSLSPGKKADILLHDTRHIMLAGWSRTDPEGTLILQCGSETLSDVLVAGQFVKRDGRLVADTSALSRRLELSRVALIERMDGAGGLQNALREQLKRFVHLSAETGRTVIGLDRSDKEELAPTTTIV